MERQHGKVELLHTDERGRAPATLAHEGARVVECNVENEDGGQFHAWYRFPLVFWEGGVLGSDGMATVNGR